MSARKKSQDLPVQAAELRAQLMGQLATARAALGLSQQELADRMGASRMTIQRAEGEDADLMLSTFLELALALQLTPALEEAAAGRGTAPDPEDLVHRGTHFNRTKHDLEFPDRRREAALAQGWEAANVSSLGLPPIFQALVPNHSQAQASAAATVIQWLGSELGFEFLNAALGRAGYDITKRKQGKSR